ncbi:phosphoribosyltransferase [Halopseudomonas sp.]|uniref:phosphoribosyltransferase n=1 Tax=Halopseudomonas sp. TaxID=2901191 RepID=UPI003564733D
MHFTDRIHAGSELAAALADYSVREEALNGKIIVLALPRGGVPVAAEIADKLALPMDVLLVRKLGVPGHEEYAMGAIAAGGLIYINQDVVDMLRVSQAQIDKVIEREEAELGRRNELYRSGRPALELEGKTVILVDDGLATGATMQVAVSALRSAGVARVVAAVPVGAPDSCNRLRAQVDELVCLHQPEGFGGVGRWYRNFDQVSDSEVIDLLSQHRGGRHEQHSESYH